ncbi:hypothetical protein AB4278_00360 [Vibrio splendidus]
MKKNVLILQQRKWALNIGLPLTNELINMGYSVSALTLKKSTHQIITEKHSDKFSHIFNHDDVMESPKSYLSREVTLAEVCNALGVDSIWPLVNSLRNHVRSYGQKYYYGFKQNCSDEEIVTYVKALFLFCSEILETTRPDIIISPNFVALPHIMLNLMAKKQGIPMQGVTDCKVRGFYIFSYSYLDDDCEFIERFKALENGMVCSVNIERAQSYLEDNRKKMSQPVYMTKNTVIASNKQTFISFLKMGKAVSRGIFKKNVNIIDTLGITIDNKPTKILVRDFIQREINIRKSIGREYYELANLENIVYFPLQFQPEASIDVAAPVFSNQLDAIRQVAMALPDDFTLVVKDHPAALGFRSHKLLDKIYHIPNVKLIRWDTPSEEVLKKCQLVVSPNSTTLMEAAIYRIPAIQLGGLGTTSILPNTHQYTDMGQISKKIKSLLEAFSKLDHDRYDKSLINFIASAFDTGWDCNYVDVWENDKKEPREVLISIYLAEISRKLNEKNN